MKKPLVTELQDRLKEKVEARKLELQAPQGGNFEIIPQPVRIPVQILDESKLSPIRAPDQAKHEEQKHPQESTPVRKIVKSPNA